MSTATQFYVSSIATLGLVNLIAVWGLDLQYGVAGIYNFAFIVLQAAGAYAAAVCSLQSPAAYGGFETYIGGLNLPFPLPLVVATLVGAALAFVIGLIAMRRLRGDYQAMAMLVLSLIATGFVQAQTHFLNGPTGLSLIPKPLNFTFTSDPLEYQWIYLLFTGVITLLVFLFMRNLTRSPFGRLLRGVRDSESAAAALGRDAGQARMIAMVLGGALAGLSGGLLVLYLGAWGPGAWFYPETFLFFTAIIVGGTGNLLGNLLGVLLIPVLVIEGTRFLPQFGYPGLVDSLDWVVIGLVTLLFLWFRPRGLFPERRRRFPLPSDAPSGLSVEAPAE